jgi:hypothetical protein
MDAASGLSLQKLLQETNGWSGQPTREENATNPNANEIAELRQF